GFHCGFPARGYKGRQFPVFCEPLLQLITRKKECRAILHTEGRPSSKFGQKFVQPAGEPRTFPRKRETENASWLQQMKHKSKTFAGVDIIVGADVCEGRLSNVRI